MFVLCSCLGLENVSDKETLIDTEIGEDHDQEEAVGYKVQTPYSVGAKPKEIKSARSPLKAIQYGDSHDSRRDERRSGKHGHSDSDSIGDSNSAKRSRHRY